MRKKWKYICKSFSHVKELLEDDRPIEDIAFEIFDALLTSFREIESFSSNFEDAFEEEREQVEIWKEDIKSGYEDIYDDLEEDIDYLLIAVYDFCDSCGIWLGI